MPVKKVKAPVLTFTDVDFTYESHLPLTLRDVDFSLAPGTLTAIVGASGSGKSTILRLAAGLLAPTLGRVTNTAHTRMVFQNGALLPWLTAQENVRFGMIDKTLSETQRERKIAAALQSVGMKHLEHMYPRDLSGGERQRVGIARALACEPELLLLDEPFSALDIMTTETLTDLIEHVLMKKKMTMLMVSHSIENAVLLADRILVCQHGALVRDITVPLSRPRSVHNPEVQALVRSIAL